MNDYNNPKLLGFLKFANLVLSSVIQTMEADETPVDAVGIGKTTLPTKPAATTKPATTTKPAAEADAPVSPPATKGAVPKNVAKAAKATNKEPVYEDADATGEAEEVTLQVLVNLAVGLSKDPEKMKAIQATCREYGVSKLSQLLPEQYAEVFGVLKAL